GRCDRSPAMPERPDHRRSAERVRGARTYWAVLIYLLAFTVLLIGLLKFYLLPAAEVARQAGPEERRKLAAGALLVLIVILFVLGAGLVLTFRIGRFFFPRPVAPRKRTEYVDAWAESGKRLELPKSDGPAEHEG